MPVPTPNINIVNGQVTGTLTKGQPFYWYNPTANDVAITIGNCGTWCEQSEYTIPAGSQQYVQAQIKSSPNENALSWVDDPSSDWTGGGTGPHITMQGSAPGTPVLNIRTGVCSGQLQNGGSIQLNNPGPGNITMTSCGAWCAASRYTIMSSSAPTVTLATVLNAEISVWTESPNRWNVGGMPHVGTLPWPTPRPIEHHDKEVA